MTERWQPNEADFIPGLELSRRFFADAVKPLLDAQFSSLVYDAGVIGSGSEVLGFDTPMSMDHHWGPRVILFVSEYDLGTHAAAIDQAMRHGLPHHFDGFPTNFEPIPGEAGTLMFVPKEAGPVAHRVTVTTVARCVKHELNYDWSVGTAPSAPDWLTFGEQKLRTLTAGSVYHSGLGELDAMRQTFAYYPDDVWLLVLAAGWQRIGQEEPFVGRTGSVGDELGSAVIAARLVRDLMRLAFLIERQYAPYSKWFGTAFTRLSVALTLEPQLRRVLAAQDWHTREDALVEAYRTIAEHFNQLGLIAPVVDVRNFHSRNFRVIGGGDIAGALVQRIESDEVRAIAERTLMGAVDQFSDSTDLLSNAHLRPALTELYRTKND
jgi:hypothetical protein